MIIAVRYLKDFCKYFRLLGSKNITDAAASSKQMAYFVPLKKLWEYANRKIAKS